MSNFDYPSSGERLNSAQRDELLQQVKQQVALASAQELIQKMSDKCFKKCVYKPGTSLDASEQAFETQNLLVQFDRQTICSQCENCVRHFCK